MRVIKEIPPIEDGKQYVCVWRDLVLNGLENDKKFIVKLEVAMQAIANVLDAYPDYLTPKKASKTKKKITKKKARKKCQK